MDITTLGHVCIDNNTSEGASYEFFGGPAMYMNLVFSRLPQVEHTILSEYGEDFERYKTQSVRLIPGKPTQKNSLTYKNDTKQGQRKQRALHRTESAVFHACDNAKKALQRADVFIFAPILPHYTAEGIMDIVSICSGTALKILLPQGYFRQFDKDDQVIYRDFIEADKLAPIFNYIIVSKEDYTNIFNLARDWYQRFQTKTIVTAGPDGASVVGGGEPVLVRTTPAKSVKDSVGAGDVFSASFAYMMGKTRDEIKSIGFAHEIARESLQYTPEEMLNWPPDIFSQMIQRHGTSPGAVPKPERFRSKAVLEHWIGFLTESVECSSLQAAN